MFVQRSLQCTMLSTLHTPLQCTMHTTTGLPFQRLPCASPHTGEETSLGALVDHRPSPRDPLPLKPAHSPRLKFRELGETLQHPTSHSNAVDLSSIHMCRSGANAFWKLILTLHTLEPCHLHSISCRVPSHMALPCAGRSFRGACIWRSGLGISLVGPTRGSHSWQGERSYNSFYQQLLPWLIEAPLQSVVQPSTTLRLYLTSVNRLQAIVDRLQAIVDRLQAIVEMPTSGS